MFDVFFKCVLLLMKLCECGDVENVENVDLECVYDDDVCVCVEDVVNDVFG